MSWVISMIDLCELIVESDINFLGHNQLCVLCFFWYEARFGESNDGLPVCKMWVHYSVSYLIGLRDYIGDTFAGLTYVINGLSVILCV
jgi:hypothetical protein